MSNATPIPIIHGDTALSDVPSKYIDICIAIKGAIKERTNKRLYVVGKYVPPYIDEFGNNLSACVWFQLRTRSGKLLTDLAFTSEHLLHNNTDTVDSLVNDALKEARRYL